MAAMNNLYQLHTILVKPPPALILSFPRLTGGFLSVPMLIYLQYFARISAANYSESKPLPLPSP